MNSLFSEFFREFPGGILGVCETIWGLFGGNFEGFLKEHYSKNSEQTAKTLFIIMIIVIIIIIETTGSRGLKHISVNLHFSGRNQAI